jgi:cytochrome c-type biogenesis protein CcmH/NrfG
LEQLQHLSRVELDRLISEEGVGDSDWLDSSTSHLEVCRDCRLALLLGESDPKTIPAAKPEEPCPGEARLKRAASGASDAQTALRVVQHCANCDGCAQKLKEYSKLFSSEAAGDIKHLKTSKPEWQKEFARQIAATKADHSRRTLFAWAGWALAIVVILGLFVFLYIQRDSVGKVNRLTATAYSEWRSTDLRLAEASFSEPRTERGNGTVNNQSLAEARAALARLRPSKSQQADFLDAEARVDLVANDVQGAYDKLNRARAQSPQSIEILGDLAVAECLLGDSGQPERYQVAYQLLTQIIDRDSRNAVALYNRALVSERLREYKSAIADWQSLLQIESKGAWADEARRHKAADEGLLNNHSQHPQSINELAS